MKGSTGTQQLGERKVLYRCKEWKSRKDDEKKNLEGGNIEKKMEDH